MTKKIPALRYLNLYKQIRKFKPKSIMEVGVWLGHTGVKMIQAAQRANPGEIITYIGFDLFEAITDKEIVTEHSKSIKANYSDVLDTLWATPGTKDIYLYQGYTKDTIPSYTEAFPEKKIDFIFIDGGHSIPTIAKDWESIQPLIGKKTIIIFDDYFNDRDDLGCKNLIGSLDRNKWKVNLLEPVDHFPKSDERGNWTQHTQMVKVIPLKI